MDLYLLVLLCALSSATAVPCCGSASNSVVPSGTQQQARPRPTASIPSSAMEALQSDLRRDAIDLGMPDTQTEPVSVALANQRGEQQSVKSGLQSPAQEARASGAQGNVTATVVANQTLSTVQQQQQQSQRSAEQLRQQEIDAGSSEEHASITFIREQLLRREWRFQRVFNNSRLPHYRQQNDAASGLQPQGADKQPVASVAHSARADVSANPSAPAASGQLVPDKLEIISRQGSIAGPPVNIGFLGRGYDALTGNPFEVGPEGSDPGFRAEVFSLRRNPNGDRGCVGFFPNWCPQGVSAYPVLSCSHSHRAVAVTTETEYLLQLKHGTSIDKQRTVSGGLSVGIGPLTVGGSASKSLAFSRSESARQFFETKTSRGVSTLFARSACTEYEARIDNINHVDDPSSPSSPPLSPAFMDDLQGLRSKYCCTSLPCSGGNPNAATGSNACERGSIDECLDSFLAFISRYGTHVVTQASFGGLRVVETDVLTEELYSRTERDNMKQWTEAAAWSLSASLEKAKPAPPADDKCCEDSVKEAVAAALSKSGQAEGSVEESNSKSETRSRVEKEYESLRKHIQDEREVNIGGRPAHEWVLWASTVKDRPMPISKLVTPMQDILSVIERGTVGGLQQTCVQKSWAKALDRYLTRTAAISWWRSEQTVSGLDVLQGQELLAANNLPHVFGVPYLGSITISFHFFFSGSVSTDGVAETILSVGPATAFEHAQEQGSKMVAFSVVNDNLHVDFADAEGLQVGAVGSLAVEESTASRRGDLRATERPTFSDVPLVDNRWHHVALVCRTPQQDDDATEPQCFLFVEKPPTVSSPTTVEYHDQVVNATIRAPGGHTGIWAAPDGANPAKGSVLDLRVAFGVLDDGPKEAVFTKVLELRALGHGSRFAMEKPREFDFLVDSPSRPSSILDPDERVLIGPQEMRKLTWQSRVFSVAFWAYAGYCAEHFLFLGTPAYFPKPSTTLLTLGPKREPTNKTLSIHIRPDFIEQTADFADTKSEYLNLDIILPAQTPEEERQLTSQRVRVGGKAFHVGLVQDRNVMRVFVNGEIKGSIPLESWQQYSGPAGRGVEDVLCIGDPESAQDSVDGWMYAVHLSNQAMTQHDIRSHYYAWIDPFVGYLNGKLPAVQRLFRLNVEAGPEGRRGGAGAFHFEFTDTDSTTVVSTALVTWSGHSHHDEARDLSPVNWFPTFASVNSDSAFSTVFTFQTDTRFRDDFLGRSGKRVGAQVKLSKIDILSVHPEENNWSFAPSPAQFRASGYNEEEPTDVTFMRIR